ncbi:MAG: hypothetical protein P8015_14470 [Acidihalobacter sp.]
MQLSDARSGVDYRLSHMALAARVNSQGELRMAGGAQLPAQIGRRVDFVAQLRGVLAPERRWSGRVYVDLKGGRLDTPLLREFLPQLPAVQGVLDARLWTSWKDGLPETVSGHAGLTRFAFSTPAVRNASAAAGTLTWLSADFSWKQTASGWQLAAKQVQAGNARRAWPGSAFSVAESSTSNGRRFYGWSDFLRIQNVVPLLEAQSVLPEELRRRLRGMAPSGDVSALRFDVLLPHEGMPQISASARFANVAVNPQDSVPGVRGASGMVRATSQGGALALDSSSLVLDAPQLFTATPPAAAAKGLVRWALHPSGIVVHGDDLDMSNADFSAHGQFGLWLPSGGRPYLTLLLHMSRGNVAGGR